MTDSTLDPCRVELRAGADRGATRSGGLAGRHHFSFAAWQRADRLEWGRLRALNEYRLEPGAVRPPTFHSGFDILTLVTGGQLRRLGGYGSRRLLGAGSAELISAGRGVDLGVEAVGKEPAHYVEIWLRTGPGRREPRREWRPQASEGLTVPIAEGPKAREGALRMRATGRVHRASLAAHRRAEFGLANDECAYLSISRGAVQINGLAGEAGDAFAVSGPGSLTVKADQAAELLLVVTAS